MRKKTKVKFPDSLKNLEQPEVDKIWKMAFSEEKIRKTESSVTKSITESSPDPAELLIVASNLKKTSMSLCKKMLQKMHKNLLENNSDDCKNATNYFMFGSVLTMLAKCQREEFIEYTKIMNEIIEKADGCFDSLINEFLENEAKLYVERLEYFSSYIDSVSVKREQEHG